MDHCLDPSFRQYFSTCICSCSVSNLFCNAWRTNWEWTHSYLTFRMLWIHIVVTSRTYHIWTRQCHCSSHIILDCIKPVLWLSFWGIQLLIPGSVGLRRCLVRHDYVFHTIEIFFQIDIVLYFLKIENIFFHRI